MEEHISLWKLLIEIIDRINNRLGELKGNVTDYKFLKLVSPFLDLVSVQLEREQEFQIKHKSSSSPLLEFYESIDKEYRTLKTLEYKQNVEQVRYHFVELNKKCKDLLKEWIKEEEEELANLKNKRQKRTFKILENFDKLLSDL